MRGPDERGTFELKGVAPGALRLVARADDGRTGSVDLKVGDVDLDGVVIRLEARPHIAGRVVDKDGRPVTEVSVTATAVESTRAGFSIDLLSAAVGGGTPVAPDGSFLLVGLDQGTYQLSVSGRLGSLALAGGEKELEVEVPQGGVDGLRLALQDRGGVLRGQVRSSGTPVANAFVQVGMEGGWQEETGA
jgi:hypothetical protein